jgi:hypothetical protein
MENTDGPNAVTKQTDDFVTGNAADSIRHTI